MRKLIYISTLFLIVQVININSQTKYLPKQYISNAQTYAQSHFASNAAMYAITSIIGIDTTGKSSSWIYWFYKPTVTDTGYAVTIIVIAGFPIPTGTRTTNLPGAFLRPLGTSFCESNLALAAAENAGGIQFRQAHPSTTINGAVSKIPGAPDTSKPYWNFIYNDSSSGQYRIFTVDGTTCSIILVGIHQISNETPQKFSLLQNYPNPFNPSTIISFEIAKKEIVTLKIFDLTGKEIEILVNSELLPGRYNINFDGSKYSSGVYLYTLEGNDFKETKKMLMVK